MVEPPARSGARAPRHTVEVAASEPSDVRGRGARQRTATRALGGLATVILVLGAFVVVSRGPGGAPGVEIFDDAAAAMERDATARFEATSTGPLSSAKLTGVVDLSRGIVRMTLESSFAGFGDDGRGETGEGEPYAAEVVVIGDTYYMRFPQTLGGAPGDVWVRYPIPQTSEGGVSPLGLSATAADTVALVQRLQDAGELDDLGTAEIRGEDTRGFRLDAPALTVMALSTGLSEAEVEADWLDSEVDASVIDGARGHIDVWIDDDGRLRRLTTTYPGFVGTNDVVEIDGETTTDTVFFDWGVAVDPTPPEPALTPEELEERFGPGPDADVPAEQGPRPDDLPPAIPDDVPFPHGISDLVVEPAEGDAVTVEFVTRGDDRDHGQRVIALYEEVLEATGWQARSFSGGSEWGRVEAAHEWVRDDRQLEVEIVATGSEATVRLIVRPWDGDSFAPATVTATPSSGSG